ncbi:reverse transcriptase domain-containing protein [Tanacetum coccineum]
MERGFLSQKGSGVGRGVKEKQVLMADKSVEVHGIHSHGSANEENKNDDGNKFSSIDVLDTMLENGPWFIRNNPLILKKWNPDVNLLKEDVVNVLVWVKLHGVPMTAFSENSLSAITTKLGTPLMLDSYTSDMCIQSWGRSSYARALIKVRVDVELKDHIMVAMPKLDEFPKNIDSDVVKNVKKPSQDTRGVLVGPKVGFKSVKQVF